MQIKHTPALYDLCGVTQDELKVLIEALEHYLGGRSGMANTADRSATAHRLVREIRAGKVG